MILDLSRFVCSSSAADTKGCLNLSSHLHGSLHLDFLLPVPRVYPFTTPGAFPWCRYLLEMAAQFLGIAPLDSPRLVETSPLRESSRTVLLPKATCYERISEQVGPTTCWKVLPLHTLHSTDIDKNLKHNIESFKNHRGGLIFIINNAKLLQYKQNELTSVQNKSQSAHSNLRKNAIANSFVIASMYCVSYKCYCYQTKYFSGTKHIKYFTQSILCSHLFSIIFRVCFKAEI